MKNYKYEYHYNRNNTYFHVSTNTLNYDSSFEFLEHLQDQLELILKDIGKTSSWKVEKLGGNRRKGIFSVECEVEPFEDKERNIQCCMDTLENNLKNLGFTSHVEPIA
jgi:hypothetical protein